MKKTLSLVLACFLMSIGVHGQTIFINEIHYDDSGADELEGFEIAGPAGTQLECFKVLTYRGSDGSRTNTINLHGRIPNQCNGMGTVWFDATGKMANTEPRGLALVWASNQNCCGMTGPDSVWQFLSWGSSFMATNGEAAGMTSVDIGVDEEPAPANGMSMQLGGTGSVYASFSWAAADTSPHTNGEVNRFQVFGVGPTCDPNSVTGDRLTFTQTVSGCTVPGETFDLTVSATNADGDIALSFNSVINISLASGPGSLSGSTSSMASNGTATFSGLSLTDAGMYQISATGGAFSGTSPNIYISANCDTCPWMTGVHIDACGNPEGSNEILFFNSGDYAVPVQNNTITVNYGMTATPSTNYTEVLTGNQSYVDILNDSAGCNLFVNASDTSPIPPNSDFMIMRFDPNFPYDFTAWCGSGIGPVFVLFSCDGDWDTIGNFKNGIDCGGGNGDDPRYFNPDFSALNNGDTCSVTHSYVPCNDLLTRGNGDGFNFGYWDSTYATRWTSCDALGALTVLPVEFGPNLGAFPVSEGIKLRWTTLREENSNYFEVQRGRSAAGPFRPLGRLQALGQSQGLRSYEYIDEDPEEEIAYYRVRAVDQNGSQQHSNVVAVSPDAFAADLFIEQEPGQEALNLQIAGEGAISIRFWSIGR